MEADGWSLERREEPDGLRLCLSGELGIGELSPALVRLESACQGARGALLLDLGRLERLDGAGAALLLDLRARLRRRGLQAELVEARGAVASLLALYGAHPPLEPAKPPPGRTGLLEDIGAGTLARVSQVRGVLDGLGQVAASACRAFVRPGQIPWRDLPRLVERFGPDAIPIVALLSTLVGVILAFQAGVQLRDFGAELFVANLVGLSVVRELGPLMAAILVAGRSGAAIAAELGTMRVGEEIDALRTLGLSPHEHLVVPRLMALLLALPVLTLVANACGVLGGLLVGVGGMGLSPSAYWNQTLSAIDLVDVLGGLAKSLAFALIIGLVACDRGLATRGGAEGVGRSTTSAVVTTILLLVIADALFAFAYQGLGL